MIRGGAQSTSHGENSSIVPVVNVVTWLVDNFREEDFIFIKMDVECAEHAIIEAMFNTSAIRLVDELAWECHNASCPHGNGAGHCSSMRRTMHAKKIRIFDEKRGGEPLKVEFGGYDSFSAPEKIHIANCADPSAAAAGLPVTRRRA